MHSDFEVEGAEPKLGLVTEEERARNAWWFRQIATTLAVGNAGGIVAISGFAANIENIDLGMVVSFPAVSFFFAGAFCAAISFVVQFIYAFTRMEAIADYTAKLNSWRADNGLAKKVGVWSTLFFVLYSGLIALSLGSSAFYFYKGASAVSHATAAIACSKARESSTCSSDGVWFFVAPSIDVRERVDAALNSEPKVKDAPATCNVVVVTPAAKTREVCKH